MDTRISAGSANDLFYFKKFKQGFFQLAAHGLFAWLEFITAEVRAFIRDGQLDITHKKLFDLFERRLDPFADLDFGTQFFEQ